MGLISLGNPDIKWEETFSWNAGIEEVSEKHSELVSESVGSEINSECFIRFQRFGMLKRETF